jgi:hypothetical protein
MRQQPPRAAGARQPAHRVEQLPQRVLPLRRAPPSNSNTAHKIPTPHHLHHWYRLGVASPAYATRSPPCTLKSA